MEKNKRQKIYDWIKKNEGHNGAEYTPIVVNQTDYNRIRVSMAARYKYASYAIRRINDDKLEMIIRIGEKIPYEKMAGASV